jgi:hypothetical protein
MNDPDYGVRLLMGFGVAACSLLLVLLHVGVWDGEQADGLFAVSWFFLTLFAAVGVASR